MNYVIKNWSFDPMLIVLALTVVAHEIGLWRLSRHSAPVRRHRRRIRAIWFYLGLATLVLAIDSPVDYWASSYFFVHMIEHILLAFFAPILIVLGAPWLPLLFVLPVKARRKVGRFIYLSSRARALRAVGRFIRDPWFALISFNAVMVLWHIPSWFELAERNGFVHIWLMHASFMVTGVLFWLQILPSSPMKPRRSAVWQAGSILLTNVIMTVMAISMSILTAVSWYPSYSHIRGVTLSPFADQQIGAAILWVCGDFWALPTLFVVIHRAMEQEGSLSNVVDRLTKRTPAMNFEAFRPSTGIDPSSEVEASLSTSEQRSVQSREKLP